MSAESNTVSVPALTGSSHSWEKRMEVVSRYMLLGNIRVVSEQTGVQYSTIVDWKKQDWWADMVDQIRRQKKTKTSDSITKIVESSLDILHDRLENGDWILNNKTGEIVRKPVGAKEAIVIANQLMQRQIQLEDLIERSSKTEDNVQDTLNALATEFIKWQKKNKKSETIDITDAVIVEDKHAVHEEREEGLSEGVRQVRESAGNHQETSGAEQSPSYDGERGQGS